MRKLIVFGAGKISEVVTVCFEQDDEYEICAYVCDDGFVTAQTFCGKPLVALSQAVERFPPQEYSAFVALGYQGMNALRAQKVDWFCQRGYALASHVNPGARGIKSIGPNSIIMAQSSLQPCASFGQNVFVWGGAMVGHHTQIGNDCWIAGGAVIGGGVRLGARCFVGVGAIIGHEVKVGDDCMLGAGTLTCRDVPAGTVLMQPDTAPYRLNTAQFCRLSSCFRV